MIKKVLIILLFVLLGLSLYSVVKYNTFGEDKTVVARHYIDYGMKESGSQNIVTAVVVLYRGFDTLGEVTVLFLAATALGALLHGLRFKSKEKEPSSLIVSTAARYIFPLIILFGTYIFVHGHLTPGGGFPGGVIIASAFLLLFLAYTQKEVSEKILAVTEGTAGILYVITGLLGLVILNSFLANFLPKGIPGKLLSAGIIPLIYILIGFKVGAEMTGVLRNLKEEEK